MKNQAKKIVCIVPCFNEESSLPHLIEALENVRTKIKNEFSLDILLINDGSSDTTQTIIQEMITSKPYMYYRNFAHNAGHQSALRAGLDASNGYAAAIMMDGDLQHPPECIPVMLREWADSKVNIVQMLRRDSHRDVGVFKYISSRGYYWFINKLSDLDLQYGASDFRLIDKSVIASIANSPEQDLFLRGYFSWLNVSKVNIEYTPNKRFAGESKYTFRKMLKLAKKGILQFSEKPLRIATNLGVLIAVLSFLYGVFIVISYLGGTRSVSGWTSLMVVTLFCFGLNFLMIGLVGRYLAHSISLQKQRPEYIVFDEKLPRIED